MKPKTPNFVLLNLWFLSRRDVERKRKELEAAEQSHQEVCNRLGEALAPPDARFGERIAVRLSGGEAGESPNGILYITKEHPSDGQQPQYLLSWKS